MRAYHLYKSELVIAKYRYIYFNIRQLVDLRPNNRKLFTSKIKIYDLSSGSSVMTGYVIGIYAPGTTAALKIIPGIRLYVDPALKPTQVITLNSTPVNK